MRRTRFVASLAIIVLAAACASGGASSTGERTGRNRNVISAEELGEIQVQNALEAVRQLRPAWLTPRGRAGLPVIYRNSTRWGRDPLSLQTIDIHSIEEIRYYNASDATTRWGTGVAGGVIQVITQ